MAFALELETADEPGEAAAHDYNALPALCPPAQPVSRHGEHVAWDWRRRVRCRLAAGLEVVRHSCRIVKHRLPVTRDDELLTALTGDACYRFAMNGIGRVARAFTVVLAIILVGCGTSTTPTSQPTSTPPPTTSTATPPRLSTPGSTSPATDAPTASPVPVASTGVATPPPTAAGTPAGTPAGTAELAPDPAEIDRHFDALQAIADANNGIRAAGTPGYEASADYVEEQLTAMGYTVERTPVLFTSFKETSPATLEIGDESWSGPEWLNAMLYSASGDVTAVAQTVGITNRFPTANGACSLTDWADFTAGNIAIAMGGPCRRLDVLNNAQASGAAAVISLYPDRGANQVLQPTLIDPSAAQIPSVTAGSEPSAALLDAAGAGAEVHLTVTVEMAPATVYNVIGELAGTH